MKCLFSSKLIFLLILTYISTINGTNLGIHITQTSPELEISNMKINCITKDSQGFIWFGTNSGLARFDGYEYKYFIHFDDDSSSLSSNFISALYVDKDSIFWVGTADGTLHMYNMSSKSFVRFKYINERIESINGDESGNLWVSYLEKVVLFNKRKKLFRNIFPSNRTKAKGYISGVTFLDQNELIIVTENSIFHFGIKYTDESISLKLIEKENSKKYISSIITCVYNDNNENLWLGMLNGKILLYNIKNKTFKEISFNKDFVLSIRSDYNNNILIGTTKKLIIVNKKKL